MMKATHSNACSRIDTVYPAAVARWIAELGARA